MLKRCQYRACRQGSAYRDAKPCIMRKTSTDSNSYRLATRTSASCEGTESSKSNDESIEVNVSNLQISASIFMPTGGPISGVQTHDCAGFRLAPMFTSPSLLTISSSLLSAMSIDFGVPRLYSAFETQI